MSPAALQEVVDGILADFAKSWPKRAPNLDTLNNLGGLLFQAGRPAEAVECFQRLLQLAPDDGRAHYNLSTALLACSRHQEAAAAAQRAWQLAPHNHEALNNLGVALVGLGRASEAVGHFQQVLALRHDYVPALNNLARVYRGLGQMPQALDYARQAVASGPDQPEAHFNLAKALSEMGQPEEALEHFYHTLRLNPEHAEAQGNIFIFLANNPHLNQVIEMATPWRQQTYLRRMTSPGIPMKGWSGPGKWRPETRNCIAGWRRPCKPAATNWEPWPIWWPPRPWRPAPGACSPRPCIGWATWGTPIS